MCSATEDRARPPTDHQGALFAGPPRTSSIIPTKNHTLDDGVRRTVHRAARTFSHRQNVSRETIGEVGHVADPCRPRSAHSPGA
jgi:hypothetical protein